MAGARGASAGAAALRVRGEASNGHPRDGLTGGTRRAGTLNDGAFAQQNFVVPAGTTLARFSMFDDDNGATNDYDIQVFRFNPGGGATLVGTSGGGSSEEEVNLVNPIAATYAVLVIDFATAPGATPYTLFNFNLNGANAGNTTVTAPAAVSGTTGTVQVDWTGLTSSRFVALSPTAPAATVSVSTCFTDDVFFW